MPLPSTLWNKRGIDVAFSVYFPEMRFRKTTLLYADNSGIKRFLIFILTQILNFANVITDVGWTYFKKYYIFDKTECAQL